MTLRAARQFQASVVNSPDRPPGQDIASVGTEKRYDDLSNEERRLPTLDSLHDAVDGGAHHVDGCEGE